MRGGGTCGLGGSSSRYAPLPTGSPSRYLLHPCITRLPTAHAAITPFCTHAPPFSHFLGRMVWGSGALGDSGAPPHAPCAFPLSLQPGRWLGLHAAGAVCSLSPVHHWAASGFIIRCRWLQLVGVALVDHIEASAVGPAPITSRPAQSAQLRSHRGQLLRIVTISPPPHQRVMGGNVPMACCQQLQRCSHHPTGPVAGGRQGTGTPFPITRQIYDRSSLFRRCPWL
jgi:hypothetical protein